MSLTSDVMSELALPGGPGAAGLARGVGQHLADHDAAPDLEGAGRQRETGTGRATANSTAAIAATAAARPRRSEA